MERIGAMERLRRNMQALRLQGRRENITNIRAYRTVSVYPSTSDLVSPNLNTLPVNVTRGPYKDINEYLHTHFSLLREDFIKPIRKDLISYLKNTNEKLHSVIIHKVQVVWESVNKNDTCVCFEIRQGVTYNYWNLKGDPKRFMTGSLLIFTKDNFKTTFCGRIADNKLIKYKKVLITFEQPVTLKYKQDYLMIECKTFYEPYFYVMKVLQITTSRTLSMQKYLVEAKSSVDMPKYLKGVKYSFKDPDLNNSQLVAINATLSQELVIIQGPPGTGKTYLGLKIAKLLLSISRKWYDDSPMLIISCTNHALDQFLEGLTDSTDELLRYGGQSKNPKMKNFSLRECRDRYYDETAQGELSKRLMAPLYKAYRNIETQIRDIEAQMNNIITSKPTCIFNFTILGLRGQEWTRFFLNKKHEDMVSWLLEEDGSIGESNKVGSSTPNQDSKKIIEVYQNYIRNSHKPSKYCIISLSIIENAADKLKNKILEMKKGIAEEKELVVSNNDVHESDSRSWRKRQQEVDTLEGIYRYLIRKFGYLKICLNVDFKKVDRNKINWRSPFTMPAYVRWQLYKEWLDVHGTYLKEKMDSLVEEYLPIYEEFNKAQEENNLEVMRYQKIIGMTTTSAARLHSTIKALKCPIVIVEEAAEVLEAHIIPVLTEHCQHLILLGDHQQLKPSTADYDIETRYKLGISLFERMVINDIRWHSLNVQHRMRPEISRLITPSIYPVLNDHESVKKFPHISGVAKPVYFITHNELEQEAGDSSKKNIHEAQFLIELAAYLLKNGYKPDDITIIAAYMGQVGALIQHQRDHEDDDVKKVKITSVDNFQGEENKIILLSLVRNNNQKKIGFLSIENRVCVALSRAKEGMYIMGNMKQLSTCSELWQKIELSLKSQEALGRYLPLKCQQHGVATKVKSAADFGLKMPNGGCDKICDKTMSCGHKCSLYCHNFDLLHEEYECPEPCVRSACNNKTQTQKKTIPKMWQASTNSTTRLWSLDKMLHGTMEDYRCDEEEIVDISSDEDTEQEIVDISEEFGAEYFSGEFSEDTEQEEIVDISEEYFGAESFNGEFSEDTEQEIVDISEEYFGSESFSGEFSEDTEQEIVDIGEEYFSEEFGAESFRGEFSEDIEQEIVEYEFWEEE